MLMLMLTHERNRALFQTQAANVREYSGNPAKNLNKGITGITYNYLNLPEVITVTGKGTITYTYDAAGNKLKKVTQENNASVPFNDINYTTDITTTTSYIGGSVYESKAYSHSALASLQYTDELQFMAHEEGRIRPVKDANNNITAFTYDYFIKDHLGNPPRRTSSRMLLTEEEKQDIYPIIRTITASPTILPILRLKPPTAPDFISSTVLVQKQDWASMT